MRVNIYHTNDIHSNYEFLKKVHKYINENKTENDLYLDSGDYLDLASIVVELDNGKSAMDLIMDAKLDLITIGNNEMDLGKERLESLLEKNYPIISSNVVSTEGEEIIGLAKSKLIEKAGKKFLIVGSTPYFAGDLTYTSYNKYFVLGDMQTIEPIAALKKEIDRNIYQYDFLIYLSHSGSAVDPYILDYMPEVNLTLGAHTHEIITEKKYSMSGKGEMLGHIVLEINEKGIEIIESKQIDLEDSDNLDFDNKINDILEVAKNEFTESINLTEDLKFDPFEENRLINFLCDALYKQYGGDLAIMHNGISNGDLLKNTNKLDILEKFPSKLYTTVFKVKGENLINAIQLSFDPDHIRLSGKAPGFRGSVLGTLSYSHNVKIDRQNNIILINGEQIESDREYTVVSSDYLQRGAGYPSLYSTDSLMDKYLIKEFIQQHLQDEDLFETSKIKRII